MTKEKKLDSSRVIFVQYGSHGTLSTQRGNQVVHDMYQAGRIDDVFFVDTLIEATEEKWVDTYFERCKRLSVADKYFAVGSDRVVLGGEYGSFLQEHMFTAAEFVRAIHCNPPPDGSSVVVYAAIPPQAYNAVVAKIAKLFSDYPMINVMVCLEKPTAVDVGAINQLWLGTRGLPQNVSVKCVDHYGAKDCLIRFESALSSPQVQQEVLDNDHFIVQLMEQQEVQPQRMEFMLGAGLVGDMAPHLCFIIFRVLFSPWRVEVHDHRLVSLGVHEDYITQTKQAIVDGVVDASVIHVESYFCFEMDVELFDGNKSLGIKTITLRSGKYAVSDDKNRKEVWCGKHGGPYKRILTTTPDKLELFEADPSYRPQVLTEYSLVYETAIQWLESQGRMEALHFLDHETGIQIAELVLELQGTADANTPVSYSGRIDILDSEKEGFLQDLGK